TADVFAARQLGRGLAAVLALEQQDQIRVATALSEISRSAVTAGRTAVITFGIDRADLLVTVSVDGEIPADGTAAAARLMDQVDADGQVVRMTKRRPPGAERLYQTELIRNSGTTLLTLVNDLLDVAKAESGQLHVDPAQVNLPALFGRLRGLARPMAEGKPVEVIVSADGD